MNILLIGDKDSKRSNFFIKAAVALGHTVNVISWDDYNADDIYTVDFVKLDPPKYRESRIEKISPIIEEYNKKLISLHKLRGIKYLNDPLAIKSTLDKIRCKKILEENNVDITPVIWIEIKSFKDLVKYIEENKVTGVFIKPRYGSGAAGVLAYRYNPRLKEAVLYTSMGIDSEGLLVNTKRMRRLVNSDEIEIIINSLLKEEVIIEKWVQKAKYNSESYDIRVVFQYGKIEFMVARGSKTPITNLHLNNCAIDISCIGLSEEKINEIEKLSAKVMDCFPGLNSAGIDLLITPKGKLMVIEVNGQGDLIYQDIYNKNKIYKSQIMGGQRRYE